MGSGSSQILFKRKSAQAADAITLLNHTDSPFLRLPPEIRNAIYAYTLGSHRICMYSQIGIEEIENELCKPGPIGDLLNITKTCRQVHSESALIFFKVNKFGAHGHAPPDWDGYERFLGNLSALQRESIEHWWTDTCCMVHVEEIRVPLDRLPGVRSLKIEQCEVEVVPRDANEARIRDLVHTKAGREIVITFDYTTRLDEEPVEGNSGVDADDSGSDDDEDDDDGDGVGDDESDANDEEEQGDNSSDDEDDGTLVYV